MNVNIVIGLLVATLCCSCEDSAEEEMDRILERLEAAGHSLKREDVFAKPGSDTADGGEVLRRAGRWLEQQEMLEIDGIDAVFGETPWASWTAKDWETLAEGVAQLEPVYKMIARATERDDVAVEWDASVIARLPGLLRYEAILAAHRQRWPIVLRVLKSQLQIAVAISVRAEFAHLVRGTFILGFTSTLKAVVDIGSTPPRTFRDALEPLLIDAQEIDLDLVFEVEACGVWVLESEMSASKKREWIGEIEAMLLALDKQNAARGEYSVAGLPSGRMGEQVRRFIRADLEAKARIQLARLGLSLMVYRQRAGQWPESLEGVEGMFTNAPVDPLTGRRFEYQSHEKGVCIRSTAVDNENDLSWELRD